MSEWQETTLNGKTAFVTGLVENEVAHGATDYIVISGKGGISAGIAHTGSTSIDLKLLFEMHHTQYSAIF